MTKHVIRTEVCSGSNRKIEQSMDYSTDEVFITVNGLPFFSVDSSTRAFWPDKTEEAFARLCNNDGVFTVVMAEDGAEYRLGTFTSAEQYLEAEFELAKWLLDQLDYAEAASVIYSSKVEHEGKAHE